MHQARGPIVPLSRARVYYAEGPPEGGPFHNWSAFRLGFKTSFRRRIGTLLGGLAGRWDTRRLGGGGAIIIGTHGLLAIHEGAQLVASERLVFEQSLGDGFPLVLIGGEDLACRGFALF